MMFESLPWYLKEYVYSHRWTSFRDIQLKAYETFMCTRDHILVSASTSGGKTEAAVFPIITDLHDNPGKGVTVLYIGPLKALIDDQFSRMEGLLKDSGIKVTSWHGDASQSRKKRLMRDPEGILQITPESLQNLIIDHRAEAKEMFSGLRYVIIDEVHAFIGTDRGSQLLCCLETIERNCGVKPRRIGLSATMSDMEYAEKWISANTGISTISLNDKTDCERRVSLEYYSYESMEVDPDDRKVSLSNYYRHLYKETVDRNCIIFTNSRSGAEKTSSSLKKIYGRYNHADRVFIHHGSISREYRQLAEEALKSDEPSTVVATVTLELGIDVGNLDRIVQINAPFTCSGLVQRMGRSGRRGNAQDLLFICNEDMDEPWNRFERISMELVKSIAMTELMQEGWIEPCKRIHRPFNLLYHQTMEYLKNTAGARFSDLVRDVLSMYPFSNIGKEDYKTLLKHLIKKEFLTKMDDGTILISVKSEKTVLSWGFCSVFEQSDEIDVRYKGKVIGSIQAKSVTGEMILLAGRPWTIVAIEDGYVDVEPGEGTADTSWNSGVPDTDTTVMRKMLEVLVSDERYPYINDAAWNRLCECRESANIIGFTETFVSIDGGYRIHPWLGTIHFDTLSRMLLNIPEIDKVRTCAPYFIEVQTDLEPEDIVSCIDSQKEYGDSLYLIMENDKLRRKKYDNYIPDELLAKEFADDRLDSDFEFQT
ncbi:MAG: DEAD/DEAH box helicase [archaeon]|nr:DEAD/DEAH box helicase [archaeon]